MSGGGIQTRAFPSITSLNGHVEFLEQVTIAGIGGSIVLQGIFYDYDRHEIPCADSNVPCTLTFTTGGKTILKAYRDAFSDSTLKLPGNNMGDVFAAARSFRGHVVSGNGRVGYGGTQTLGQYDGTVDSAHVPTTAWPDQLNSGDLFEFGVPFGAPVQAINSGGGGAGGSLPRTGTPSPTNPTIANATNVVLLPANLSRKWLFIQNNSAGDIMFNPAGGTLSGIVPSASNPGIVLKAGASYESLAYCPTSAITVYQTSGGSINTVSVIEG